MGMSSSQARLLNLTARMHQIEYKAARLEAQKLQMANESTRVYNDYLNALEASKIQYKALNTDGSITYKDATLKALENGILGFANTSANTLFLQNIDTDKIMVTTEVANYYGLTSQEITVPLDTYVHDTTGLDKTIPVGFNKIANTDITDPVHTTTYSFNPVTNLDGGINTEALPNFAQFDNSHPSNPIYQSIAAVDTVDVNGNYTVSSAAQLQKLMSVDGFKGNIVLTSNIDMSSITNWTGIKDFCGTFDGNGYTISNLSGSQGLFKNVVSCYYDEDLDDSVYYNPEIKNISLTNVNITVTENNVGGLIGSATSVNVKNCSVTGSVTGGTHNNIGGVVGYICVGEEDNATVYFDNIASNVNVAGNNNVGGVFGNAESNPGSDLNLRNIYSLGNVTGNNNVGGVAGNLYYDNDARINNVISVENIQSLIDSNGKINYQALDSYGRVTDICNIYSGGSVSGNNNVGGFCGKMFYWGDGGDYCFILNSQSTGSVDGQSDSSGAFIGAINISLSSGAGWVNPEVQKIVNFVNCTYASNAGPESGFGVIYDNNNNNVTDLVQEGGEGLEPMLLETIPSVADYASNIMNVFVKSGVIDPLAYNVDESEIAGMYAKINAFLNQFTDNNSDNTKLYYLNEVICDYLGGNGNESFAEALLNDVNATTKTNTSDYQAGSITGKVTRGTGSGYPIDGYRTDANGTVTIPSKADLANEIYAELSLKGRTVQKEQVEQWLNLYTNSSEDMVSLANINNFIQNDTNLDRIYAAISMRTKLNDSTEYNTGDWDISFASTSSCVVEYAWDTSNSAIAQAITMWKLSQRGVEIVDDEQAESKEWLANMVNDGFAVLTTFSPENLSNMSADQIISMDDDEFYVALNVVNTSVSTNTSVQEVQDKVLLRKAEATYEAAMKKIDMKDRKYDTDLAALDTERNAIKSEIDTLKTVAKDNVDRTFKLFG